MFLIGLTGSAIPYLIFLGIVVVFTLGTNTEVLNKKCMPPIKSDMHLTYAEQIPQQAVTADFNYTEHHSFQNRLVDQPDHCRINDTAVPHWTTVIRRSYASSTAPYSSAVCASYFGLSPPVVA
ncbi:hypothetical protein [Mangrovibacterium marinum]|uniref:Uncharacterized protein n=1 Tax=Mangrovibacterium marinum TaxID=1639118 RepID=A0A2T5BZ65_9BACT|nr:hypothetical protein [Mangrovibacterium marinum]PTN07539.1 hypothetical protein C8N47_11664 [Mangrovibacterium marinum]